MFLKIADIPTGLTFDTVSSTINCSICSGFELCIWNLGKGAFLRKDFKAKANPSMQRRSYLFAATSILYKTSVLNPSFVFFCSDSNISFSDVTPSNSIPNSKHKSSNCSSAILN